MREAHSGRMPETMDELMSLPGIGRSTAGAILALSLDERQPILDGNVKRVLCRHAGIEGWPDRSATAKSLWQLADRLTAREAMRRLHPGHHGSWRDSLPSIPAALSAVPGG